MEAVKQSGMALKYVHDQTPEICVEAVKKDKEAIKYVDINIFEEEFVEIEGKKITKEALYKFISNL